MCYFHDCTVCQTCVAFMNDISEATLGSNQTVHDRHFTFTVSHVCANCLCVKARNQLSITCVW